MVLLNPAYFQAQLINKQVIPPYVSLANTSNVENDAPVERIKFYQRIVAPGYTSTPSVNPDDNPSEIGYWYINTNDNKLWHWHCGDWHHARHLRVIIDASGYAADGTTIISSATDYAGYAYHTNHCGYMCQIHWGVISDDLYEHIVAPNASWCVNPIDNPSEIGYWRIHCGRLYEWNIRCEEWRHARCKKVYLQVSGVAADNSTTILSDSEYAGQTYKTDSCGYLELVVDIVLDDAKHLYQAHCDTPLTPVNSGRYFNKLNREGHHSHHHGVVAYELYEVVSGNTDGAYITLPNFNGRTQFSLTRYGFLYCDRSQWYRFNYIIDEIHELWEAIEECCCALGSGTDAPAAITALLAKAQGKAAKQPVTAPSAQVDASENAGIANPNADNAEFDGQDDVTDNTNNNTNDNLPFFDTNGQVVDGSGNLFQVDASGHELNTTVPPPAPMPTPDATPAPAPAPDATPAPAPAPDATPAPVTA